MLLIRKDLADKAGLKTHHLDEWHRWAKARRPGDRTVPWPAISGFNEDVFEFVGGNGGSIWDKDGMPALVSDEMAAVLEFYKKIQDVLPPGWLADGYVETMNTMALGRRHRRGSGAARSATSRSTPRPISRTPRRTR